MNPAANLCRSISVLIYLCMLIYSKMIKYIEYKILVES